MAYIPLTNKKLEAKNSSIYRYTVPTGGVKISDNGISTDGKCSILCNMDVSDGILKTRPCQKILCENPSIQGTLYSITKNTFCDRIIMHIGQSLYAFNPEDNTISEISSTLPDEKSLICAFMSKLYIYSAMRVFSLDEELKLVEEEPDAPLLFDGIGTSNSASKKRLDVPINLVAPRIAARYTSGFSIPVNSSGYYIHLPYDMDLSREVRVYADGEEIDKSLLKFEDVSYVRVASGSNLDACKEVVVKYYVQNLSDIGFEYDIGKCSIAEPFGGNTMSGTRIFFTGNQEKKGYYFKSDLQNPLNVSSDDIEIIGDGCENVTAVIRMYSYLIIFTEKSVYRMSYSLENDGAFFGIRQIGIGVGCDCPDSVALIDNRAVFANSSKGIFIVDPDGDTDEHNIKPISGNVNADFLDNDKDVLEKSCGIDFDRKYMLFAGNKAYIWDYDNSTFYDSGNYQKSQERLIWYMYDGLVSDMYFGSGNKLVSLDRTNFVFYGFDREGTYNVSSHIRSGKINFGDPKNRKFVTSMELDIKTTAEADVTVTGFADGIKAFEKHLSLYNGNKDRHSIRLPKIKLYDFDFEVSGSEGFEMGDVFIEYTRLKK